MTPDTSDGFAVIEFARDVLGIELLPWQEQAAIRALELAPDGSYRFRTVVILVGRQCGKTTLLKVMSAFWLFVDRVRLVLGVAQSLDIAREAWAGVVELAESVGDLRPEVRDVRRANGEQCLTTVDGCRYRIAAASRQAGRGLSVNRLILDELREHRDWQAWGALTKTTIAQPDGQVFAISNQGDDESVVLNSLRDAALAFIGTGEGDDSLGLLEWSAPDGCDLDDPQAWAQGAPGLGHTISERAIRAALATDPPAVFRTEVLCQRVSALDAAIGLDAWRACSDESGSLGSARERVALCLDVAPDLLHATLAAAAVMPDGRVRVEIVAAWSGPDCTNRVRVDLPGWRDRIRPRALGWFPGGPAASLTADLKGQRGVAEIRAADALAACQGLAEQVAARRLLHPGDPLLNAQVQGTKRLYSGDGWRFTRRGAGHCDAVYAAAGAAHLARTAPVVGKPRLVVAKTPA